MPSTLRLLNSLLALVIACATGGSPPDAQAASATTPSTAMPATETPATDPIADGAVQQVLERFSRLIHDKNPAIADEFTDDALLCGSEPGELAIGKPAIRAFLTRALAKPHRLRWEWQTPHVKRRGNLIWFFVESTVVADTGGMIERSPYRVSGVLERTAAGWRWREYDGSEPAVHGDADGPGAAPSFVTVTPDHLVWHDIPGGLGARYAVLTGDDDRPGMYVIRVRFPPHVMDRPHSHPNARYVTVLDGTWYAGTGPDFDPTRATPLPPGSVMVHPAGAIHWDGAAGDEPVTVQIVGEGPGKSIPLEPERAQWVHVP